MLLAQFEAARGRRDEAERILRRQIELENTHAWLYLGNLYADAGRPEDAEAAFRAAIDAGQLAGHALLAKLLAGQPGRRDEVEHHHRIALAHGHTSAKSVEELPTAAITI